MPPTSQPPEPPEAKHKKRGLWSGVRNTLLAGLAVILPVGITAWVIKVIGVDLLDKPARGLLVRIVRLFTPDDPGLADIIQNSFFPVGLVLTIVFIIVVGLVTKSFLGRQFLNLAEYIVEKLPLVRSIYGGIKQLSDAIFTSAGSKSFNRAVLVKFMGEDAYAVGFVTSETKGEAQAVTPDKVVNIFVPTTPNPTSGYLLMVPESKLIPLSMTVEEAIKMVISGGMVTPPAPPKLKAPAEAEGS